MTNITLPHRDGPVTRFGGHPKDRPGTSMQPPIVGKYQPGTQKGSAPRLDVPNLVQQTERELAVLLLLKKQNTLASTETMLLKLADEHVPAFLARLRDPDPTTRLLTARIVGQKKLPAAKELLPLLSDPMIGVREAAHQALVRLARGTDFGPFFTDSAPKHKQAVQRWENWLTSQEPLPAAIDQGPANPNQGRPEAPPIVEKK
jgi:hypothetical protein